jgi:hypothetical protein
MVYLFEVNLTSNGSPIAVDTDELAYTCTLAPI